MYIHIMICLAYIMQQPVINKHIHHGLPTKKDPGGLDSPIVSLHTPVILNKLPGHVLDFLSFILFDSYNKLSATVETSMIFCLLQHIVCLQKLSGKWVVPYCPRMVALWWSRLPSLSIASSTPPTVINATLGHKSVCRFSLGAIPVILSRFLWHFIIVLSSMLINLSLITMGGK